MSLIKGGFLDRRGFLRTTAAGAAIGATGLGFAPTRARAQKKGGVIRAAIGHGSTSDTLDPGTWENDFVITRLTLRIRPLEMTSSSPRPMDSAAI